jgi:hypothetical protein
MMMFDVMAHHEAIEVIGAERFARYEGYAHSFRFAGDFVDTTARDACGKVSLTLRLHLTVLPPLLRLYKTAPAHIPFASDVKRVSDA